MVLNMRREPRIMMMMMMMMMIIIIIIIIIRNLKCTIVPVIIGATGIVTRSLRKNLETVPGKHSIDSLQKTDILRNFTHNTKNTAV